MGGRSLEGFFFFCGGGRPKPPMPRAFPKVGSRRPKPNGPLREGVLLGGEFLFWCGGGRPKPPCLELSRRSAQGGRSRMDPCAKGCCRGQGQPHRWVRQPPSVRAPNVHQVANKGGPSLRWTLVPDPPLQTDPPRAELEGTPFGNPGGPTQGATAGQPHGGRPSPQGSRKWVKLASSDNHSPRLAMHL